MSVHEYYEVCSEDHYEKDNKIVSMIRRISKNNFKIGKQYL